MKILAIIILAVLTMACGCSGEPTKYTFSKGQFVQVKLTGEIGMVIQPLYGAEYEVKLQKNLEVERFEEFELTFVGEQGTLSQSGGTVPPPNETSNEIFNNEKVWNPQTQRYE